MKKTIIAVALLIVMFQCATAALIPGAKLIPVKGTLRYKSGDADYRETAEPVTVYGTVWVDTGRDGCAKIQFPLHQGSEIRLQRETMVRLQGRSVFINYGQAWFNIGESLKEIYIKTPTAVAGTGGTVFEADVRAGMTQFYVFDGKIYLYKRLEKLRHEVVAATSAEVAETRISEKSSFSIEERVREFWSNLIWTRMHLKHLEKIKKGLKVKDYNNSFSDRRNGPILEVQNEELLPCEDENGDAVRGYDEL